MIFLNGNFTRQKRSNATTVSVNMEQETVESDIKLADYCSWYPTEPIILTRYLPYKSSRHITDRKQYICDSHVYN